MKSNLSYRLYIQLIIVLLFNISCSNDNDEDIDTVQDDNVVTPTPQPEEPDSRFAPIDFSNWKITLPVDTDNNNSPDEYLSEDLINYNYQNNDVLSEFLFDHTADTSLVFYTYPAGATTTNSSYPRTELREQITPGNNYDNWKLSDRGTLEATIKIDTISKDTESSNTYHRVIVSQIHGIVSQADVAKYNLDSNHAPPLLKMYWIDGEIWAHKKSLKDESTSGADLYNDSSNTWTDIKFNFGEVNFNKFTLKIEAEAGRLFVTVNGQTHTFEDTSLQKWPFENYFKAGNYLISTQEEAFAKVKFYDLEVIH